MDGNREEIQNGTKEKSKVNQQCSGVVCPNCGGPTRVRNGKPHKEKGIHGRYRRCDVCFTTFYTEEKLSYVINIPDKNE